MDRPPAARPTTETGQLGIYLSLGSNVGDRHALIARALDRLDAHPGIRIRCVSGWYETEPVGGVPQGDFVNIAAGVETGLSPLELLAAVKDVERALGRDTPVRWGPRAIDIDVILWGDRIDASETLTLPHPEFRSRRFVLAPLAEIAPDAVDPVTGLTVAALLAAPEASGRVVRESRPLWRA